MKKKRVLLEERVLNKMIYSNDIIKISKEGNEWFFEIGSELTTDIAEAVSILMRKCDDTHSIWNIEIKDINTNEISPMKSLFWLSGGTKEWITLDNYKKPWCDCFLDIQEEFGLSIIDIINESNTLGEIRKGFIKNLNLPIIYEFALSRDIVR